MNTRHASALRCVIAPAIVGALLVTGCGSGTTTSQSTASQTATPTPPQQTPQPAAAQATPTAESPRAATPATAAPQATTPAASANAMVQEHEHAGIEVTIVELKRTGGDSVTLKWRYRNTSQAPQQLSKGGSSWYDVYRLSADSFLVDPVNKKKYLVITDDKQIPLASKHGDWQGVTLDAGQSINAWAKFPAPPADVQKVTVTISGVPPYEDVPIVK